MVTKFEKTLPLQRIDIDEFERRLKLLATQNNLSKEQLFESFKDSSSLGGIVMRGNIT